MRDKAQESMTREGEKQNENQTIIIQETHHYKRNYYTHVVCTDFKLPAKVVSWDGQNSGLACTGVHMHRQVTWDTCSARLSILYLDMNYRGL